MSRDRVQVRADLIYNFLSEHLTERFTLAELCNALGINASGTTRTAIARARDMATERGYHFPPAVPQNGMTYAVTNLAEDAFDPTLHMTRLETGVRRRKETGIEFMRRERHTLPRSMRPIVDIQLTMHDAIGTIVKAADDFAVEMVRIRRDDRAGE